MTNNAAGLKNLFSTREILGVDVADYTFKEALSTLRIMAEMPFGQTVVAFLNANNSNLASEDPGYREILRKQLVLPDGHGVDLASRLLLGSSFPDNLNGTDLIPAWFTYLAEPKRIGLIGARADVLKAAARNFREHTPWHEFIEISDGYIDDEQSEKVMADVGALKLDILVVAMGSPRQEKWIDRHVKPDHARVVVSVGALFDFMSGIVPRAPKWMRDWRLEWIYRLHKEPARLWKRYLVGNPLFLIRVLRQCYRRL